MSTAISTNVQTIDYPALAPSSRQMRIIQANLDGEAIRETDLVRVKTPLGGSTTFSFDNNGNVETAEELTGLLVGIGKRGYLWPSEDPTEQRPVIVSNDLVTGYRVSDELGTIDPKALEKFRIGDRLYDWAAMSAGPPFGWDNTSKGKATKSKRLKEMRILAILRSGDIWPLLVTVGGGSLYDWDTFRKKLPSFHYECVLGIRAERAKNAAGQPFAKLRFRIAGIISEEQGEVARRTYTEALTKMFTATPIGANTVDAVDAQAVDAQVEDES